MNHDQKIMSAAKWVMLALGGGAVLLAVLLAGCVHEHRAVYAPPPTRDYVAANIVVQDNYVYYPGYQIYFSSSRNRYIYMEGRSWVSRPAPPRVPVGVLFASPSVRLDFHDAPEIHHSRVIRQYPKHWRPPGEDRGHGQEKRNNEKGNDRENRR